MTDTASSRQREFAPVVALDIGNVCVELDTTSCAERLGYNSLGALLDGNPELLRYERALECGQLTEPDFFSFLARSLPAAWSEADVIPWWCSILHAEMPGMAEVVENVVALGLKPVFFSDISPTHLESARSMLSFAELVPDAVCSFEVGALKPDPRMYAAFETQVCNDRFPVLYVDDKPDNVAQAQQRGWPAVVFSSAASLAERISTSAALTVAGACA